MTHPSDWLPDWSSPLQALQEELNRVLAQFRATRPTTSRSEGWTPSVDLVEFPGELRLWVDLPGVAADSIELTVSGALLVIRGVRAVPEAKPGAEQDHLRERPSGLFFRQLELPREVNSDTIHAEVRDGVLEVVLPKTEALRPHSIPIRGPEDRP